MSKNGAVETVMKLNIQGFLAATVFVAFSTSVFAAGQVKLESTHQAEKDKQFDELSSVIVADDGSLLAIDNTETELVSVTADGIKRIALKGEKKAVDSRSIAGLEKISDDRYILVDGSDDRLVVIDASGAPQYSIGSDGRDAGQLSGPSDVAYSHNGRVYVADTDNDRISVFSEDGVFMRVFGLPESEDKPQTGLKSPKKIAIDGEENIYVLDGDEPGRITVFGSNGQVKKRFSGNKFKQAGATRDVEITAIDASENGILYIADQGNGKIIQFDWFNDKAIDVFGSRGEGRGQFEEIVDIDALNDGRVAIADVSAKKIDIYQLPQSGNKVDRVRLPTVGFGEPRAMQCETAYAVGEGDIYCLNEDGQLLKYAAGSTDPKVFMDKIDSPEQVRVTPEYVMAIYDDEKITIRRHDGSTVLDMGRYGSDDGGFENPQDIDIRDNVIYVADTGNDRIQLFTIDGIFLRKIVGEKDSEKTPEIKKLNSPTRISVDSNGNVFVADGEINKIRAYNPAGEPLYILGASEPSKDTFEEILDLSVDDDNNLLVLASTDFNRYGVYVYRGSEEIVRFANYGEKGTELSEASALSVLSNRQTLVTVYDVERQRLNGYKFLQIPERVGGVYIKGKAAGPFLTWQQVPGNYVASYRVYGSDSKNGKYRLLKETDETKSFVKQQPGVRFYRVSAVSGFGVESEKSRPLEDAFSTAYVAYEAGQYKDASVALAQAYKTDAENPDLLKLYGQTLIRLGDYDGAVSIFDALGRISGYEQKSLQYQLEAYAAGNDLLAARDLLDRVIAGKPDELEPYVNCGEVNLKLGDGIGAVNCLEDALAKSPDNANVHLMLGEAYIKVGVPDSGFAEITKASNLGQSDEIIQVKAGELLYDQKKYKEALAHFDAAIALNKDNADAQLGAARTHMALKQYAKARGIAKTLSAHSKHGPKGNYLLGLVDLAEGNSQQALLSLNRATRGQDASVEVWLALASVYDALKQTDRGTSALESAVKAKDANYDAYFQLGQRYLAENKSAKAVEQLNKAVEKNPGAYDAQLALGQALFKAGESSDARKHASKALTLKENDLESLTLLADISSAQGKTSDAISYAQRALEADGNSYRMNLQLGRLYLQNNLFDKAEQYIDKSIVLDKSKAGGFVARGDLLLSKRLFDKAIKAYETGVKLDGNQDNRVKLDAAFAAKKKALDFANNAPQIAIESIVFEPVFSSAYKQYADKPVGRVTLRNLSSKDYNSLKLSLELKGYQDFPTSTDIPVLKANSTQEFPLKAALNSKVLEIDEDTGVQAQIKVAYFREGKQDSIDATQRITMYGKNAIVWRDSNMVGSFVTPKDDVLRDFVRQSINQFQPEPGPLNKSMVQAMTFFNSLNATGTKYLVDPNNPFTNVTEDQVDYVQFPRETLKLRSGDCDDLSVLYSAGLENLGIQTALLDVPGHLLMMFNTGVSAENASAVSSDAGLTVVQDGTVWVPVEATMVAQPFSEAWAEGANKYKKFKASGELKVIAMKDAWQKYQPATLAKSGDKVALPAAERVASLVDRDRGLLLGKSLDRLIKPYQAMLDSGIETQLATMQIGIIYAKTGLYDKAVETFDGLLRENPSNSSAHNNLGNVYLKKGDYSRALDSYSYAERLDSNDGGVKLNLAIAYYKLGQLGKARDKFEQAKVLDDNVAAKRAGFANLLVN